MIIEERVFTAFAAGKEEGIETLFHQYYKTLVSFATRHGITQMEAEDIVIDIFHYIWEKRENIPSAPALKNLLYTSVHNRSMNAYRNAAIKRTILRDGYSEEMDADDDDSEILFIEEEASRVLDEAVNDLTPQCRKVILALLEGKTMVRIAEEMGITASAVKTYKARALKMLQEKLKDKPIYFWMLLLRIS